jgi:hypothetical protein
VGPDERTGAGDGGRGAGARRSRPAGRAEVAGGGAAGRRVGGPDGGGLLPRVVGCEARLAVPSRLGTPVEALVTGFGGGVLRMESRDPRVLGLDGVAVIVECPTGDELVRLKGRLDVLVRVPPPFLAAVVVFDEPLRIQRRRARRVRTRVPVRLLRDRKGAFPVAAVLTETLDLSAGGMLVRDADGIGAGEGVVVELDLPGGTLRVRGRVLEVRAGGRGRVAFEELPEGTTKRLARYVFTVELAAAPERLDPPRR